MKNILLKLFPALIAGLIIGGLVYADVSPAAVWRVVSSYVKPVNDSWGLQVSSLANCNTIDTDANGKMSCGTDEGGTSMAFPASGVAVSTGSAWTTSLSTDGSGDCTSGAVCLGDHTHSGYLTSLSGAVLTDQTAGQTIGDTTNRLTKLWATDITVTNAITGSVSGNAGTATALAANGANCDAGSAPLGVDASGAAEGCFAVVTGTPWTGMGYLTAESDPQVDTVTSGNFCKGTGTQVSCTDSTTYLASNGKAADADTLDSHDTSYFQTALTYPVTGVASPTAGYLTKWGASGNTLADAFKYGTLTDGKWCSYSTANGLACTENTPGGAGATTALDNLASVNINTDLMFDNIITPSNRSIYVADQSQTNVVGTGINIYGGKGNGTAYGGSVLVYGGESGDGNTSGAEFYVAPGKNSGQAAAESTFQGAIGYNAKGGDMGFIGGRANGSSGNHNGGDVYFRGGEPYGEGTYGMIKFASLAAPTYYAIFNTASLTADRTFTFPNASGTFLLAGTADSITEDMLKVVDSASDEECLTYETTTGDFEWQSCGSGGLASTDIDTSSELAGILTDESGSGNVVFSNSPSFTTPTLGAATATTINGLTLTSTATGFTIAGGTSSKTLTLDEDLKATAVVDYINVESYGIIPANSAATNTTNWGTLLAAVDAGSTIYFPAGHYNINDDLDVSKALNIIGDGDSSVVHQTVTGKTAFTITASNVDIENIYLEGYGTSWVSGGRAVYVDGAVDGYLSDITVKNVGMHNLEESGVRLEYVKQYNVHSNHISAIGGYGVLDASGIDGKITNNFIDDIKCGLPESNGYGIAITSLTPGTDPSPVRIAIENNIITNVLLWEGIDTHGGESIIVNGNIVKNTKRGIAIIDDGVVPPKNVTVSNNYVESAVTDGSNEPGIVLGGRSTTELATGTITGNTVSYHGNQADNEGGGILVYKTSGAVVSGNKVVNSSPSGIIFDGYNYGFSCTGNTIVDSWTESVLSTTGAKGIMVYGYQNEGIVNGNSVSTNGLSKTYILSSATGKGINVFNDSTNIVNLGTNFLYDSTTRLSDVGSRSFAWQDVPLRFPDLGYIADNNGNELIVMDTVASAVNHIMVTNASTTNAPIISAVGDDDNIPLYIKSKGNQSVYITADALQVVPNTLTAPTVYMVANSVDNIGPSFYGRKHRNGNIVQSGDQSFAINSYAWDGSAYRGVGLISFYIDGTPGSGDMPGRISFWTTPDGSTSLTERMKLDNAGTLTMLNGYHFMVGGATLEAGSTNSIGIANGTAPNAHVDNEVILFSTDTGDSTATLGLYLEQAVESVGTFTAANKIKVNINGTLYWIQLDPV